MGAQLFPLLLPAKRNALNEDYSLQLKKKRHTQTSLCVFNENGRVQPPRLPVIFHDLSTDPARDVEFDVERVVDFEGETGPYLQYAHTRCLSILRKARETGQLKEPVGSGAFFDEALIAQLGKPEELALVKALGQFPLHLERTLRFAKASQLAHYLIDVTRAFGGFYRECRVLGEAPELTRARLMLVEATRRVLAQGLGLMLIPLPERM